MHGNVSSFGSANGISVVALADFGKAGVGGVDGSSGATGKSSSGSINNDEDEIEDDDLLVLLEGDEDAERSPKNTDKSDMYGKTLKTAVSRVHNSGSVSGSVTARAQQLKRPLNKNSYTPQFYDISLITSGNGVSMANYIETPDKYTYSQEKQNHVHLGTLDNSGSLRGQATLEGGTRTPHTYTKSKGSGNGVSLFASTGRFAKNTTRVALDNVNNDGHISGQIRQISGNNSGYNSPHMMSGSQAHGSGNGISLYSDTFNAQIPRVETRLGNITNRGSIRGDAYLKAGDGSGDLSIEARASGNGISVYQATGNASLTALESVNNEGIIQGHIETRAGTVYSSAQRGQTIPEERARLIVSDDKTIADYYKPNPTPEKPAAAGNDNYGSFANFHAYTDVRASGNGISVQYASLGNINNSGVISGYSENYHGYARGYGRVSTLNSGAGIATDRHITNPINNRGIISGNHAAILAKGRVDDSQSIREPNLEPGYEPGKIKNYGLMAGSMIAGSYRAGAGNLLSREQNFDHFDSSAATNDPLENYGSKIYLKTGIRRVAEYGAPTVRSDDYEHIDRIVNGAGGTHRINGQRYTIQNGTLDASGTDSEHKASGNLRNHIINGAGVARGALVADGKLALSNSIVNGYANALYLGANSDVTLNRSTLNANGHKINRSIDPLAVRGDDGANRLTLNHSTVNGNINLGAGNDTVHLGQPGRRAPHRTPGQPPRTARQPRARPAPRRNLRRHQRQPRPQRHPKNQRQQSARQPTRHRHQPRHNQRPHPRRDRQRWSRKNRQQPRQPPQRQQPLHRRARHQNPGRPQPHRRPRLQPGQPQRHAPHHQRLRQPKPRRAQQTQRHQRLRRKQIHPARERPSRLGAKSHPRLQPPQKRQRERKWQRRAEHRQPRHEHRGHRHRPRPHLHRQSGQRRNPWQTLAGLHPHQRRKRPASTL